MAKNSDISIQVAPGIYRVRVPIPDNPLGHLNCYLVEGKNGWLMVDTGWYTPDAFSALEAGLRGLDLGFADIATIVVTHVHPDHFGLAGRIKQISPKTELVTHRWEVDLIESRYIRLSDLREKMYQMLARHGVPAADLPLLGSASMPAIQFVTVTLPDRTVYGGEIISTGVYDLELIWTPGHSSGHICLYEPQNQVLFSGDHVLPKITPNISRNVQSGDNPLGDFIGSLHKIENLPAKVVLPAHEDTFTDLKGRIGQILVHHHRREAEIKEAISQRPLSAYDVSSRITWDIPLAWEQFPALHKRSAVTETLAHLDWMRWKGQVERLEQDGVYLYRAVGA
ncbi:MAG: MBL fold metallo-hydrolase [Chloroflexi bacterium]|nr:MBL fold metallo-hydrolase [Chloroflexota bacterium]